MSHSDHIAASPAASSSADTLRALHHGPEPLVLPNAWDAGTARLVAASGFPVVATSSVAVAASLGFGDGEQAPAEEVLAGLRRIVAAIDVPVTADIESGYGLAPADLADRLVEIGVAGCNFEDTDHRAGAVRPMEEAAARIAELRSAQPELVINARTDVFLGGDLERLDEGIARMRAYAAAGADCVYPILLRDEPALRRIVREVDVPVNAMAPPDRTAIARLAELGVTRISLGGGLAKVANAAISAALDGLV